MSTPESSRRNIIRSASIVGAGTLVSRILGLIRDQVTAYYFGASPVADAFFVAFRIPNFLRRLLAEGALTPAFVPVFTKRLETEGTASGARLYRGAFTLMGLILIAITAVGLIPAPQIVSIMAPGFIHNEEQFRLTVLLSRILFPYILFMSLTALAMGALNSLGQFSVPALGPVLLNLSMIAGSALISQHLKTPIIGLAIGAITGGFLQLAIQLPFLIKAGPFLGLSFNFRDPDILKMLKLMIPAALGAASYQISILVNNQLASILTEGSISWLYYADRLMQFPLGVFSVALATAVLPALSRHSAQGDEAGFRKTLNESLGLQFFITIPATIGLIIMAYPLVGLLFERGQFGPQSTAATASALWAYVLGLPFLSGTALLARAFYSKANTKTPALVASIALGLDIILALILIWPLKHVGLALASSLTSLINFVWLIVILKKRDNYTIRPLVKELLGQLLWATIMGLALWPLFNGGYFSETSRLFRIILGLVLGPVIYFGLALIFKCPHLKPLNRFLKKVAGKQKS